MIRETIEIAKHYGYGVESADVSFNWAKIKAARDAYVKRLNGIYERNLGNSGVEYIQGFATFSGPKTLQVGDRTLTADHIMLAPGGYPSSMDVPGAELGISSDGFFELEDLPAKTAVIGAGYIAVELAGVLNGLGSDVSLVVRGEMAIRRFDPLVRDTLDSEMKAAGITIRNNSNVTSVERQENGKLTVTLDNGEPMVDVDCLLWAIGRKPATAALNLPAAGVNVNGRDYITVDEYQNTSAEGVYALGDVTGPVELTPVAIAAGRRLADRLFGGVPDAKLNYENVPTVVFSHPPIGGVGLTEPDARQKYGDGIKVYQSKFGNMLYSPLPEDAHKPRTAMKVICEGPTERVVGIHVIGLGADEMMQGFGVAVKMGCTKGDLDNCIAIHPTASEELVTMAPWGNSPLSRANL